MSQLGLPARESTLENEVKSEKRERGGDGFRAGAGVLSSVTSTTT